MRSQHAPHLYRSSLAPHAVRSCAARACCPVGHCYSLSDELSDEARALELA